MPVRRWVQERVTALARALTWWTRADSASKLYWVSVLAVFATGVLFRSVRYFHDPIALWGDEAHWVLRLMERPVLAPSFRPLGFMLLSRGLAEVFGADERALRLPAYFGSIASLWLLFQLSSVWLRQRLARLVVLGIAAFHPMLIDFAREFKPYSLELAVHLFLLWRCVRFLQSGARRDLAWLLLSAPVCVLFAYNAVFSFPALFGVLGLSLLRARRWLELRWVVGSAAACLATVGTIAVVIFAEIPEREDDSRFWGQKYGVFYIPNLAQSRAAWMLEKTLEMARFPGAGRLYWELPEGLSGAFRDVFVQCESWIWILLAALGGFSLVRAREWSRLGLLLLPLLVMLLFNAFGRWPWGAFRVNLFALAYTLPIAGLGLDWVLSRTVGMQWLPALLAASLCLGPSLSFGFGTHQVKRAWTGHSEFPKLVEHIRRARQARLALDPGAEREVILLDSYTCGTQRYYFEQHRAFRAQHAKYSSDHFTWRCVRGVEGLAKGVAARRGQRTWVIVSKWPLAPHVRRAVERVAKVGEVLEQEHSHLLLRSDG